MIIHAITLFIILGYWRKYIIFSWITLSVFEWHQLFPIAHTPGNTFWLFLTMDFADRGFDRKL
jgi:hypothetical protein